MKKTFLKFTSLFCAFLVGFTCLTNSYRKAKAVEPIGITILVGLAGWGIQQAVTGICGLINTAYENSLPITKEEHYAGLNMLVEFFKDNNKFNPDDPNFLKTVEFLNLETKDDLKAYLEQQYIEYSGGEIDINSLGEFYNSYLVPTFGENAVQNWDTFHLLVWSICNHSEIKGYTPQKIVDYVKRNYKDSGVGITDNGTPTFSAEAFANEVIETLNKYIDPKNPTMLKFSWDEYVQKNDVSKSDNSYYQLGRCLFQDDKTIFGDTRKDGIYIQFYSIDNGDVYYSPYQYHFWEERTYEPIGYEKNIVVYSWYVEPIYYENLNGQSLDKFTSKVAQYRDGYDASKDTFKRADFKYCNFGGDGNYFYVSGYNSMLGAKDMLSSDNVIGYLSSGYAPSGGATSRTMLLNYPSSRSYSGYNFTQADVTFSSSYSSAADKMLRSYDCSNHFRNLSSFNDYYNNKYLEDLGFFVSPEPFSTTYLIDTTKIPSNTTVTMSGDTVYDYSITDNSTGDSTTIGEYVENNYTFNGDINQGGSGGTGGSGGSVNGNITVGGQVDVGGSVDVNVDVNINGSLGGVAGGAGSAGGSDDLDKWVTSDTSGQIAEYLGQIPELPKTFIDYIKDFFAWLPKEILGLIVLGFVAIVVKLILRR